MMRKETLHGDDREIIRATSFRDVMGSRLSRFSFYISLDAYICLHLPSRQAQEAIKDRVSRVEGRYFWPAFAIFIFEISSAYA